MDGWKGTPYNEGPALPLESAVRKMNSVCPAMLFPLPNTVARIKPTFWLVWMTVKRGKKPWAMACLTIWKAALMRAWEAMMLARVARIHRGKKVPLGRLLQKLVE